MNGRLVLLDIEVQRDFFAPGGSCYTKTASSAVTKIYDLFRWAGICGIPIISTVLRIRPSQRSCLSSRPNCLEDSDGERKLSRTVLPDRINMGLRNCTDLPANLLSQYRQVLFEKRITNIFAHARAERLISRIKNATFIILGAGLAHGIAEAALGLRNRGFAVIVASDAVLDLNHLLAEMARLRMEAKGVLFLPSAKIIATGTRNETKRKHRPNTAQQGGKNVAAMKAIEMA